ncbi:hypothetical protein [Sedimenticola hydrogenitrophicus]|uniref:hypothetical protein n=1 Tax=Sedimenticola hydrogenitrophicus TaxID=2967975 RepID=UPI0021A5380D|nr:hypothetical protein [Sedimenticola hydrogenitrophicus]
MTTALVGLGPSACSTKEVVGGAAIGGAAYEYSNKRAMDELKEDYQSGRISNDEYQRRKNEIEGRSVIY